MVGAAKTISFSAILTAGVLSSLAINWGYGFILILSCISTILSAIFVISIERVPQMKSTEEARYFDLLRSGINDAFKDRKILSLLVFLSLAYALGGALDEYWTLFANETGLPNYGLGVFLAVMSASQASASFFAHKLIVRWSVLLAVLSFWIDFARGGIFV